ncbi:hypothetical protein KCU98_g158, partial [Aureobasidium melanogenum]
MPSNFGLCSLLPPAGFCSTSMYCCCIALLLALASLLSIFPASAHDPLDRLIHFLLTHIWEAEKHISGCGGEWRVQRHDVGDQVCEISLYVDEVRLIERGDASLQNFCADEFADLGCRWGVGGKGWENRAQNTADEGTTALGEDESTHSEL